MSSPPNARPMTEAAIALGSNLGNRLQQLRDAAQMLQAEMGHQGEWSRIYETQAIDCLDPQPFLNAVWVFPSEKSPIELLQLCWSTEQKAGRTRMYPNAPRTLDLDLLYVGETLMHTPQLILPHPRMPERLFVLEPLAELRPEWVHPQSSKEIADLITPLRCKETEPSVVVTNHAWALPLSAIRADFQAENPASIPGN